MTDKSIERIYIGGLDPSRGLTVELVASRLCDVKDIAIHSINDVAITQCMEMQSNGESIYNSKREVFDEDGDLVDTRKFFYVEASVTAPTLGATPTVSALGLLAKQYNGVKWMGCNLRVESARPHFLKRLEQERQRRSDSQEYLDEHAHRDEAAQSMGREEIVFKNRRRLRIRKRFGEEAFHVDTVPHPIELRCGIDDEDVEGWNQFSALHTRMHDKWQSQHRKLVERRKIERRLWASGKKVGLTSETEKNNDLRSLMFLNRGIHIRFNDHDVGRKENSPCVSQQEVSVATSSAQSSDTEDSSTNEDRKSSVNDAYIWSDDSDEVAREDQGDIESIGSVTSDECETEKQYRWSDDETEEGHSTVKSQNCNIDTTQQHGVEGISSRKSRKTLVDGSEYAPAVAIDEFSCGLDFDSVINFHEGASAVIDGDSDVDDELEGENEETSHLCLDDDIRSNMDILSQLFPDEYFEKKPLATLLTSSDVGNVSLHEKVEKGGQSKSTFVRGGLIMQRYDPMKEEDKRFEIVVADHTLSNKTAQMEDILEQDSKKTTKCAAISLESTLRLLHEKDSSAPPCEKSMTVDDEVNTVQSKEIYQQDRPEDMFNDSRNGPSELSFPNIYQSEEQHLSSQNTDRVEREVYEQDKLEDIFKQGRTDGEQSGGFTFGFLSQPGVTTANESRGNTAPFSFGFVPNPDTPDLTSRPEIFEESSNNRKSEDACKIVSSEQEIEMLPRSKQVKRKRFSEQELDRFEDLFFSLNEGQQIMKQETANQELWQKERQVLTADWKRKQKAALSRKGKQGRRL